MADRSSSGPPAPEPKRYPGVTRHRDTVPDGHGEPRPPDKSQGRGKGKEGAFKGDAGHGNPRPAGEAKGVSKGKEKGDQGLEGHGQSRPAKGRGKGKAVDPKGAIKGKQGKDRGATLPKAGKGKGASSGVQPRRRSASSLEYSRRRAGKRQRESGQYFRWSKAAPAAPVAKAVPPAPPPPRRRQDPESSSHSDETEEEGQGVWLRSRTPPDRRVPAEPSAPPKARGTVVKSRAEIVVPQEVEGRSESTSSSPEPARGSRPEEAEQASGARPGAQQPRLVPEPVLQVCPQHLGESSRPAGADPPPAPEDVPVTRNKRPPLRIGASGLPEVPFPDFREAKSYQRMRLPKPVFLASLRLVRGLCCYGCNVSFSIGELSSHLFSAKHQRICLEFAGLVGPTAQRAAVQGTAK